MVADKINSMAGGDEMKQKLLEVQSVTGLSEGKLGDAANIVEKVK